MITLDKIRIKTNYNYLLTKDVQFNQKYKRNSGELYQEFYNSNDDPQVPYTLYIAIDYEKQTLTLQFTSKILGDDYPKLISCKTIRECLDNVNRIGICTIDVDKILANSAVTSMDITVDVPTILTEKDLTAMDSLVGGYKRYKWQTYSDSGITFNRDVKSQSYKDSLVVYLKGKEIGKRDNQPFLASLTNPEAIKDYFRDKTRFELSLDCKRKIQDMFKIKDVYLHDILELDNSILLQQFDRVFGNLQSSQPSLTEKDRYDQFAMKCILQVYGNDLKQVEQAIRNNGLFASRSGRDKRLKKIEALYKAMQGEEANNRLLEIRNLLEKCVSPQVCQNNLVNSY